MINRVLTITFILLFAWHIQVFAETRELVVLYTNDRHGEMFPVKGHGGLAPLATFIKGVVEKCIEKGLLINCTHDKVLHLMPPLIVAKKDINRAISILDDSLKTLDNLNIVKKGEEVSEK